MLYSDSPEAQAILRTLGVDVTKSTRVVIIFEAQKFVQVDIETMVDNEGIPGLQILSNQYTLDKKTKVKNDPCS